MSGIGGEPDDLLLGLAALPKEDIGDVRASGIEIRARREIARRRRVKQFRHELLARVCGRIVQPALALALSAAFVAWVFADTMLVLGQAHGGFFWP